jgi:SNF2 family DNA or RNA helicase
LSIVLRSGVLGEFVDGGWRNLNASELVEREADLERDQPSLMLSKSIWEPQLTIQNSTESMIRPTCRVELVNRQTVVPVETPVSASVDYVIAESRIAPVSGQTMEFLTEIQELNLNSRTSGIKIADVVSLDRLVKKYEISIFGRPILDTCFKSSESQDFEHRLTIEPYPYQIAGIEWLVAQREQGVRGVLLADVMGLGKTLQGIGLLAHEIASGRQNNLILCPGTLTENWRRELVRFAPHLEVFLHKGPTRSGLSRRLREHDVVVSTYDVLLQDWQLFLDVDWNVVLLDEAQAIKNPDAARSRRSKSLSRQFGVAITGTPLENRSLDLWSIADFAQSEALPERRLVEDARFLNFEDQISIAESLNDVVRPMMLRRQLIDVDLQLPERVEIDHVLEWPAELISLYEETRATALAEFSRAGGLVAVSRLRKLTTHPVMVGLDSSDPRELSPKFVQLAAILEELIQRCEKAIVFCGYTTMIDYIASWIDETFKDSLVLKLDGRTEMDNRQLMIEEFNEDQRGGVLVTNPTVAGAGLNITGANHVIMYNLEWNPAKEAQAIARIHRNGQVRTCFVHRFFYVSTIEDVINQRLREKRELAAVGVDGGLSKNDIQDALRVTPGAGRVA